MSASGNSSHWRRQSLPPYRNWDSLNSVAMSLRKHFSPDPIPEFSSPSELNLPPDRPLDEGLNDKRLKTLEIPSVQCSDGEVKITDLRYIGSYNWTKRDHPTIIVPGSPPGWRNRHLPYNVQPDMALQYVDQNGYRMPSAPLLPLVVAVDKKYKDEGSAPFPWGSIDFVTDRNNLRKLLRWIGGGSIKEFRIDTQLAGRKTVLMNRWEKRHLERSSGRTYGHQFERHSTFAAEGCPESSAHHRIVSYDLDGLKMVVRYEVDACMPQPRKRLSKKSVQSSDSLSDAMRNMSLASSTAAPFSSSTMPALTIINGGSSVLQESTIEITTCSRARRPDFNWMEVYPQLFLSQTTHHFLAIHQRGRFDDIEKRKLSSPDPDLQAVEKEMQPAFKKLQEILMIIQNIVIEHGSRGRLSFVCSGGHLAVYQRKSQTSCLPDEVLSCFEKL